MDQSILPIISLEKKWKFDFLNGHVVYLTNNIITCCCINSSMFKRVDTCIFMMRIIKGLWSNSKLYDSIINPLETKTKTKTKEKENKKLPPIVCPICCKYISINNRLWETILCFNCFGIFHKSCIKSNNITLCPACNGGKIYVNCEIPLPKKTPKNRYWCEKSRKWLEKKIRFCDDN